MLLLRDSSVRRFDPASGGVETVSGKRLPTLLGLAPDGSLVGVDPMFDSVVRIDLEAGTVATISSLLRGEGPSWGADPSDLDVDADGSIWLVGLHCCVFVIDPTTGDRSEVSSGLAMSPVRLAVEPGPTVLLTHFWSSTGGLGGSTFFTEGVDRLDPTGVPTLSTVLPLMTDIVYDGTYASPYGQIDIATTPDGRIYTSVGGWGHVPRITRIDPVSGLREAISGLGIGAGPEWGLPARLVARSDAELLAFDSLAGTIVSVDLANGDRSIVSGDGVGSGPALLDLIGVEPEGTLLAWGGVGESGILRVEPLTGDRSLVLAAAIGSGPPVYAGTEHARSTLAAEPYALFATSDSGLVRIDPATGERSIVMWVGPPPETFSTSKVADRRAADGRLVVLDSTQSGPAVPSVVLVDRATGERTKLSGPDTGSGPLWEGAADVAVGEAGIYVLDADGILRVDPETGERSIVTDPSTGSGELFGPAAALAVTPDGGLYVLGPWLMLTGSSPQPGIFQVDAVTGDRTRLTALGPPIWDWSFDLAATDDGNLLAVVGGWFGQRTLYAVDAVSGTLTLLAQGDIAAVAVVPEPDAAALALVAFAALATRMRTAQTRHGERRQD